MNVFPDDELPEKEYYTIKVCSECVNYYFVRHYKIKKWHRHPQKCPNCEGEWME